MSLNDTKEKPNKIALRGNRNILPELYEKTTDRIKKLDTDLIISISTGLMKGLSPEDACAVALVAPSQYHRWYGIGKNLMEGRPSKHIPELIPLQPGEEKENYDLRKEEWRKECDLYVDFYLLCNQAQQVLSENMMSVIVEYAQSDAFDRWRAAREVLRMTSDSYDNEPIKHEHVVSGSVEHTHESPQIQTLLQNIAKSIGTALPEPNIVEGEAVSVKPDDQAN